MTSDAGADREKQSPCEIDRMVIRPMRAQDVDMERCFVDRFSLASGCFRFLELMRAPDVARLRTLSAFNPLTDVGFVALTLVGSTESPVGVARFSTGPERSDCRFAVSIADQWRRNGLGTRLMQHLVEAARARGIATMHSSAARDDDLMHRFARHMKWGHRRDPDDDRQTLYSIDLPAREFRERSELAREHAK